MSEPTDTRAADANVARDGARRSAWWVVPGALGYIGVSIGLLYVAGLLGAAGLAVLAAAQIALVAALLRVSTRSPGHQG
jgi:hypothetical protein